MDLATIVGGAITLLVGVLGAYLVKQISDAKRREIIGRLVRASYGVVKEIVDLTENKVDDKAAEGLKQLADLLQANQLKALTAGEEKLVRAEFSALHAAERKSEELALLVPR